MNDQAKAERGYEHVIAFKTDHAGTQPYTDHEHINVLNEIVHDEFPGVFDTDDQDLLELHVREADINLFMRQWGDYLLDVVQQDGGKGEIYPMVDGKMWPPLGRARGAQEIDAAAEADDRHGES